MDELMIRSKFVKGIISTLIRKKIKENLGMDASIDLQDISLVIKDGKAKLDIGCTIETDQMNILSLLKL
jgi:hypothetical protein